MFTSGCVPAELAFIYIIAASNTAYQIFTAFIVLVMPDFVRLITPQNKLYCFSEKKFWGLDALYGLLTLYYKWKKNPLK